MVLFQVFISVMTFIGGNVVLNFFDIVTDTSAAGRGSILNTVKVHLVEV